MARMPAAPSSRRRTRDRQPSGASSFFISIGVAVVAGVLPRPASAARPSLVLDVKGGGVGLPAGTGGAKPRQDEGGSGASPPRDEPHPKFGANAFGKEVGDLRAQRWVAKSQQLIGMLETFAELQENCSKSVVPKAASSALPDTSALEKSLEKLEASLKELEREATELSKAAKSRQLKDESLVRQAEEVRKALSHTDAAIKAHRSGNSASEPEQPHDVSSSTGSAASN